MHLRRLALLGTLWVAFASALDFGSLATELPACALNCSISELSTTSAACGLAALDTTCLCTNTTLQLSLTVCIQDVCNLTEQFEVQALNNKICPDAMKGSDNTSTIRVGIGLGVTTFVLIVLRCISRYTVAPKFWLDDYAILAAGLAYIGILILDALAQKTGEVGVHIWQVDANDVLPLGKYFFAGSILYVVCLYATKLSILLMYLRIFATTGFRKIVMVMIVFVSLWAISAVCAGLFRCRPVQGAWDVSITSKCANEKAIAYSAAAIGIIQDILILLLPMPKIIPLQMSRTKKIQVVVVFGVGTFACIASIVRLGFLISFGNSKDFTRANMIPALWSIIEINVAMICACLPTVRALFAHWLPKFISFETIAHQYSLSKKKLSSSASSEEKTDSHSTKDREDSVSKEESASKEPYNNADGTTFC